MENFILGFAAGFAFCGAVINYGEPVYSWISWNVFQARVWISRNITDRAAWAAADERARVVHEEAIAFLKRKERK